MGDIYVVNGFYATMQADYVEPGASIYYYSVQWNAASLSWEEFRSSVLGATDPSAARAGSLRRDVLDNWEELGLAERPNIGRNAVHGSASPLEALVERLNWLAASIDEDETAAAIMDAGVKKDTLLAWTKDPQVEWEGASVSLFDAMEDLSVPAMLKKAQKLGGDPFEDTPKFSVNQAFLFIKPHAVNDAVKEHVRSALRKRGITVVSGAHRARAAPRVASSCPRRAAPRVAASSPAKTRAAPPPTPPRPPPPRPPPPPCPPPCALASRAPRAACRVQRAPSMRRPSRSTSSWTTTTMPSPARRAPPQPARPPLPARHLSRRVRLRTLLRSPSLVLALALAPGPGPWPWPWPCPWPRR